MSAPPTNAVVAAFRALLLTSVALQAYVGVDGDADDPSAARIYQKWSIDFEPTHYPAITLFVPRRRLDAVMPRTWNPGFVQVQCYSQQRDQMECLEMYEISSRLLHMEKNALSTEAVCVHGVFERDGNDPIFQESTSSWVLTTIYKVYASIRD